MAESEDTAVSCHGTQDFSIDLCKEASVSSETRAMEMGFFFSSPSLKHFSRPCFSACAPAQTLQHNKNKNKLSPILYLRRQRRWPQQGSNLNPFIVNSPSGRMTPKRHHKAFELKGPLLTGMNPEESSRRKQAGYAEPGLHKSAICCESRRAHPPPDCRSHFKMRAVTAAAVPRCQQLRWLQPY